MSDLANRMLAKLAGLRQLSPAPSAPSSPPPAAGTMPPPEARTEALPEDLVAIGVPSEGILSWSRSVPDWLADATKAAGYRWIRYAVSWQADTATHAAWWAQVVALLGADRCTEVGDRVELAALRAALPPPARRQRTDRRPASRGAAPAAPAAPDMDAVLASLRRQVENGATPAAAVELAVALGHLPASAAAPMVAVLGQLRPTVAGQKVAAAPLEGDR